MSHWISLLLSKSLFQLFSFFFCGFGFCSYGVSTSSAWHHLILHDNEMPTLGINSKLQLPVHCLQNWVRFWVAMLGLIEGIWKCWLEKERRGRLLMCSFNNFGLLITSQRDLIWQCGLGWGAFTTKCRKC